MTDIPTQPNHDRMATQDDLREVTNRLASIERTLRGTNGSDGLVSRIQAVEIGINHLNSSLDTKIQLALSQVVQDVAISKVAQEAQSKDAITWQWIVDRVMIAIILIIVGYFLTQVLTSYFPGQ